MLFRTTIVNEKGENKEIIPNTPGETEEEKRQLKQLVGDGMEQCFNYRCLVVMKEEQSRKLERRLKGEKNSNPYIHPFDSSRNQQN